MSNEFLPSIAIVDIALMSMLCVITIAIMRLRSLFAIVMLAGVYSLVSAAWFQAMDAVDVSFTEAAVGAGISTALMLGAMLLTARTAKASPRAGFKSWAPLVVVIATGATLLYASVDLPAFGAADSPVNTGVGMGYVDSTPKEVGTPNIVTAVLASYRGFDTFGETVVVFSAGVAVILLIGFGERAIAASDWRGKEEEDAEGDDSHLILRVVAKSLIPLIMMFGFYVHFHGEYSPGGGFQAGVIFAVAIMLYSLIFGLRAAMRAFPPVWARVGAAVGVACYGITGVICMLNGGRFLDYDYIFGPPTGEPHGHHNWPQLTGIIGVEVGVVVAVACVMITAFYAFAGRVPEIRDEDW